MVLPDCFGITHGKLVAGLIREERKGLLMKTRFARTMLVALIAVLPATGSWAATRIASLYIENFNELQRQLSLAGTLYEAPSLNMLPIMLTSQLPGAGGMDNSQPIAVHVMDTGADKPGIVLEVSAVATPEAFLKNLVGADAPLPAAVDGLYKLADGTLARIVGKRLFMMPSSMGGGDDALIKSLINATPAMPVLPGAIRVTVLPSAMLPMIDKGLREFENMPATDAEAVAARTMLKAMLDFYRQAFSQIEALHLGVAVQNEGFFLRSRLAPRAGTDAAAIIASMQPVQNAQLAFIDKDALFSYASGRVELPEKLKQGVIKWYTDMLALNPVTKGVSSEAFAALMALSMKQIGRPLAGSFGVAPDGRTVQMQGVIQMADAAAYLDEYFALVRKPEVQKSMGMKFTEPVSRMHQGTKIMTLRGLVDEKTFEAMIPGAVPEQMDAMRDTIGILGAMGFTSNDISYAATPGAMVYTMGPSGAIEQALGRLKAPASAEATRIRTVLAPSAAPCSIGRFSFGGIMRYVLNLMSDKQLGGMPAMAAAAAMQAGDGIFFGSWRTGNELLAALHVPPSEVKALKVQMQALQGAAGRRSAPAITFDIEPDFEELDEAPAAPEAKPAAPQAAPAAPAVPAAPQAAPIAL